MKLLIFLILLINFLIYPQDIDLIGVPGGRVLELKAHPSYNLIFAGLDEGSIFKSNNSGNSNIYIEAGLGNYSIKEIALLNNDSLYIFINAANIITGRSTNGGMDWWLISQTAMSSKVVINSLNPSVIYRSDNNKDIWKSYDKGDSWFLLKSFNSNLRSIAIARTDTSILYVGADFTFYKSIDSGNNWIEVLDTTVAIEITQIEVNPYNENSIYLLANGKLCKSEDGGERLKILTGSGGFTVNPLDTLIIYSMTGGISKTTDEGLTWSQVNNGLPGYPNCLEIDPNNPEVLYAGINYLGVSKTTNGGEDWFPTNLSYSGSIREILIHRSGKIEVGQYGWGIMKTTNNGSDWIHPSFVPNDFQNLICGDITYHPQDSSKGFLAAYLALGKTTDGGESWYSTYQLPGILGVAYYPSRPETLFAASADIPAGSSWLHQSTDGGETWNVIIDFQYFNEGVDEFYFDPIDKDIIYAIGSTKILKSTDAGLTWVNKVAGIVGYGGYVNGISSFSIQKNTPSILYCTQQALSSNQKGHLYKSTNGGEVWFIIDSALYSFDPMASVSSILLDHENPGRIYIGIIPTLQPVMPQYTNGGLYLTENDGKHWRKVYGGEVSLIKADYKNPRNIYFATKFGLMTLLDTLTVTSVDLITNDIPEEYSLSQNYPNPFNPTTRINYSIKEAGMVSLKVYDILGREVVTVVNEMKQPGNYEVNLFAGEFASGVYIYKLQVNGYLSTKKMLIVK